MRLTGPWSLLRAPRCPAAPLLVGLALLLALPIAAPTRAGSREAALGQGTRTSFTSEGLRVEQGQPGRGRAWQWEMPLRSFGRGASQGAVVSSGVARAAGRLEYRRGVLTEWYVKAGPVIEQGFTVGAKPEGTGPLALRFELRTDLTPALSRDARSLHFDAPGGARLHYAGLTAFDARGTVLPARFVLGAGEVVLEVDDGGAVYPLTIDPLIYMEAKQVAFDASTDDGYGASVAVDFDTVVVGAPGYDDVTAGDDVGAAYVYVRVGAAWVLQQKLTAADMETGDAFGSAVAVSGDTIVVGAPGDDDAVAGADAGSAYVFRRTSGVWTPLGKLLAPDLAAADGFGSAVAVSGGTALVGAPAGDGGVADSGSAYAFVFDPIAATAPAFEAELVAADGAAGDAFGAAVSLDGDTAVVGAAGDDDAGADSGAAYAFVRDAAVWTQEQKLVASDDNAGDRFGASVGVSGDTTVVGAPGDDDQDTDAGSAYVFVRFGTSWTELDEIFSGDADADEASGSSVAISSDAILVGAPFDDDRGEVNVYARDGVEWPRVMRIRASDREDFDAFGSAVAISGGSLAVGAPLDDDLIPDQGGAYLFYANQQDVDIEVAVAVSDPQPTEGSEVVLTVNVTNWGPDDAEVVAIHAPFPAVLTFVDSLASYGTYNVQTGIWEIGDLPNYTSASLTLTGLVPAGTTGTMVTIDATLLAFDATPENDSATETAEIGGQGTPGGGNFCPGAPSPGCLAAGSAVLKIDESRAGKEKLKVTLKSLGAATLPADFGDPVGGTTLYDLCIYDEADVLAGGLRVDRAGATCGAALCWKATKAGFKYSDPLRTAGGVKKLKTKSGAPGKGAVSAVAGNNVAKGQNAMPVGIASALAGDTSATVQVLTDDAACFEAVLGTVRQSDGIRFKAKAP